MHLPRWGRRLNLGAMKVGLFHPGTQHSWQTARALQELDALAFFATSIFYDPDRWPYRIERYLPGPIARRFHAEFRRFAASGIDPRLVRTHGLFEWVERLCNRAGMLQLAKRIDRFGNRRFVRALAPAITGAEPFALWGYNASSLESFRLARSVGRTCILDRTIGDFRPYNRAMAAIRGEYGDFFLPGEHAIRDKVIERDDAEYRAADVIVVGSEFAAQTVRDGAGDADIARKLRVLPYCYDEALFAGLPASRPAREGPVRFLFLGQLSPRKGVHLALEAIARLPRDAATLTLVGPMAIPARTFERFADRVEYRPAVARADVPGIMAAHDVFLMPSYFEGAGIVLYEALAAGMGIIQSGMCAEVATPDTGLYLDRLDTAALVAAMESVIADRAMLAGWRAHAQAKARQYAFAGYRDRIGALLAELDR